MEKKSTSPCSCLFVFLILGFVIILAYRFFKFFQDPHALTKFVEALQGLGLCLGIVILGFAFLFLASLVSSKITEIKLSVFSKKYPLRCYPVEIERPVDTQDSVNLYESRLGESIFPVYLLFSVTNYGIRLSSIPSYYSWDCISADNENRYRALISDGPIILRIGYIHLYYILYNQSGSIKFKMGPSGEIGYSVPLLANLGIYNVEIVIVFSAIKEDENVNKMSTKERLLKLELVALDQDGHDDPATTRELYDAIFESKKRYDSMHEDYYY